MSIDLNWLVMLSGTFGSTKSWIAANADSNWVAAIGQVLGAIFTAVAAWVALRTARIAREVAEKGVAATQRQTSVAAIESLLKDYADPKLYDALRIFGRFVANDPDHKEKFAIITDQYRDAGNKVTDCMVEQPHFAWVVQRLEAHLEIGAARRQIHHHFKRVWALRRAGVVSDTDLYLLTKANYGYELWQNEVLPVTEALGVVQRKKGRRSAADETWR